MRFARLLIAIVFAVLSLTPALAPTPAAAQSAPSNIDTVCKGTINIVRVSDIKPGMMQKFMDAVGAQAAWYKNAGSPDTIGVVHIMNQDPATKLWSLSETQAMTTHLIPPESKNKPHDAAYTAFVAMFSASSTIKTQYMTCAAM